MTEPLDIQSVLQNGYFTTSGGKVSPSPSPSRLTSPPSSPPKPSSSWRDNIRVTAVPEPRRPRVRPPPPTVEDERDALAKEFGSATLSDPADELAQEKGDVDQYPVLLEVHEHNPERRFVLVPTSDDAPRQTAKSKTDDVDKRKEDGSSDERTAAPRSPRRPESQADLDIPRRSPSRRRRSRPDLPSIDTGLRQDRAPEHHRTQSAVGPRPEGFSSRSSASRGDDMLSPDIIKNGSGRRERAYHGSGSYTPGSRRLVPQRSYSNMVDERRHDRPQRRESLSPAVQGARSESTPDPRKLRRRPSNEQMAGSRPRDEPSSARASRRDNSVSYKRDGVASTPVTSSPRPMGPRPNEDTVPPPRPRRQAASIHQDTQPVPIPERDVGPRPENRPRPRGLSMTKQTPPTMSPIRDESLNPKILAGAAGAAAAGAAATIPIASEDRHPKLPHPDDMPTGRGGRSPVQSSRAPYSTSSPDVPLGPSVPTERGSESTKPVTTPVSSKTSPSWPPKFEPERDGLPTDQEIGSYRRYSEGRGGSNIPVLPECQRKEPVAGKMDWLTLPRTDLNICPACYEGVFGHTEYRTLFQPMLRPSDKPIACDFGSSPWHRIAWLLTLKNDHPDLRLLHRVDDVANDSRSQPCPGSRKALRSWYTIRDPYTRRPIPNFTVCYQCAMMVEILLPSLKGVFTPVDSREPPSSVCALHFKPQRKRFALFFDTLETTADKAARYNEPPNLDSLATKIERLTSVDECREDSPIPDTSWYTMQFLPEFTVCADCFDSVVRPRLATDTVARNFYKNPQRMPLATCQLYSERMREVFRKACRRNDPQYLQAKVLERRTVEADIHGQLVKLDRAGHDDAWVEQQVGKLIQEWKKWE